MIVYNERDDEIYLSNLNNVTQIGPHSNYSLSSTEVVTNIKIVDSKLKKIFDMNLPTDPNLQIFDDKAVFDSDVIFYFKTNTRLIIILLFLFVAIGSFILWKY